MTEPTDEQVAAFKAAWEAENLRQARIAPAGEPGDRTRAGLRAVLQGILLTSKEAELASLWLSAWKAEYQIGQSGWEDVDDLIRKLEEAIES